MWLAFVTLYISVQARRFVSSVGGSYSDRFYVAFVSRVSVQYVTIVCGLSPSFPALVIMHFPITV
jgi:hypothetical protein